MLLPELQHEAGGFLADFRQHQLDDIAGFVFEFHRQVFIAKDRSGVSKRFEQFASRDAMVGVFSHPRLQQAGHHAADRSATIDKIALHATDLRHMKMHFDGLAVRPDHHQGQLGCRSERRLECGKEQSSRAGMGVGAAAGFIGCHHEKWASEFEL